MKNIKKYLPGIIGIIILIFLDQITKYFAIAKLKNQNPFIIIEDIFQLQYLENRGAAFGLLQGKKMIFIIMGIIILAAVIYIYVKMPVTKKYLPLRICAVMIASGAIGNMIDRIRLNYVVDFFYFELIDFPVFNVADIYVTVSAFGLVLLLLFYYKEEELTFIGKVKS